MTLCGEVGADDRLEPLEPPGLLAPKEAATAGGSSAQSPKGSPWSAKAQELVTKGIATRSKDATNVAPRNREATSNKNTTHQSTNHL